MWVINLVKPNFSISLAILLLGSCATSTELKNTSNSQQSKADEKEISTSSVLQSTSGPIENPSGDLDAVWLRPEGSKKSGQGILVSGRNDCAVLTLSHVVDNASDVSVIHFGGRASQGRVRVDDQLNDLALIEFPSNTLSGCVRAPQQRQVDRAVLKQPRGDIRIITEGGTVKLIPVRLESITDEYVTIVIDAPDRGIEIRQGTSGAPVIMDGIVVGLLQSVTVGQRRTLGKVVRIDFATRILGDRLGPSQALPTPMFEPFDLRQLPADIREVAEQARKTRKLAEAAAEAAREVAGECEVAAARAKALPFGQYKDGYANFVNVVGTAKWAGQAKFIEDGTGTTTTGIGYGIYQSTEGENAGNETKCYFNNGCQGRGGLYFALNPGNINELLNWFGDMKGLDRYGYGYLQWRTGGAGGEAFFNWRPDKFPLPGVWIESDGLRFEGFIGPSRDGKGVLWNREGQVIQIGTWQGGSLIN